MKRLGPRESRSVAWQMRLKRRTKILLRLSPAPLGSPLVVRKSKKLGALENSEILVFERTPPRLGVGVFYGSIQPLRGRDVLWDAAPRVATQDGGASQPWAKRLKSRWDCRHLLRKTKAN